MPIALNNSAIERALLEADAWLRPFAAQLRYVLEAAASGQVIGDDPVGRWGPHALAARRAATLDRFHAGYDAWMGWVDAFQHLREELVQRPELLRCLSSICAADLHSLTFNATFDATGFVWPTRVCFAEATFGKDAWFGGCVFHDVVDFTATRFLGPAIFERSRFVGDADFSGALFGGSGEFRLCAFDKEARFSRARFAKDAWFRGSRFANSASFVEATFQGEAGLGASTFRGDADFSTASFADNAVVRYSRARALRAIHGSSTTRSRALRTSTARASPVEFASTMARRSPSNRRCTNSSHWSRPPWRPTKLRLSKSDDCRPASREPAAKQAWPEGKLRRRSDSSFDKLRIQDDVTVSCRTMDCFPRLQAGVAMTNMFSPGSSARRSAGRA